VAALPTQRRPLQRVDNWMATYRAFFADRFDRLEEHLSSLTDATPADHPEETTR